MSISAALSNAFSGLSTGARLAELASDNIANALTEGFARRQGMVTSRANGSTGLGVKVISVERQVNNGLLQDIRLSHAAGSASQTTLEFLKQIEATLGDPTREDSLPGRVATLEKALIEAAARPESDTRLGSVIEAARQLVSGLNNASRTVQSSRQGAENAIAGDVQTLNASLKDIQSFNQQILRMTASGEDVSALLDLRQQSVDKIAEIVPLREIPRPGQQIALFTTTGVALLDGRRAVIGFDAHNPLAPGMTVENGALSGLSVNGQPISTQPAGGRLGYGRLAAAFEVRDRLAGAAQSGLDLLARNLIERFSGPAMDPTLSTGEAGLFIDPNGPLAPDTEAGLASRIVVNPVADPAKGGALWHLRDGMLMPSPQNSANPALLQSAAAALTKLTTVASAGFSFSGSYSQLVAEFSAAQSSARLSIETEHSFSVARSEALTSEFLKDGVDTDREMQDLMLIEQAYGANARVIQTVDQMLRTILEI